uniref:Uncharacterized protein n=1 Tax=Meloidogyne enterolobii TaxID=390850 RepID=A0A6V7V2B2_MELEN|nr:unnamed protein product [Meloidogyne enterolobii]
MKQNHHQHQSFDQLTIVSSSTLSNNAICLPSTAKKTVRRLCSSIAKFGPSRSPPPPIFRKVSAPGSGKQRKSSIPSALLPSLIVATVGGDTPDSGLRMDFAFGRTGNWIFIF